MEGLLSPQERLILLRLARQAIEEAIQGKPSSPIDLQSLGQSNAVQVRVRRTSDMNGEVPFFFARAMGFNLVKLCLVIPTPAYFAAADEEGMLLWEELPMWLPEVNEQVREVAPVEYRAIAAELALLGCEVERGQIDLRAVEQVEEVPVEELDVDGLDQGMREFGPGADNDIFELAHGLPVQVSDGPSKDFA